MFVGEKNLPSMNKISPMLTTSVSTLLKLERPILKKTFPVFKTLVILSFLILVGKTNLYAQGFPEINQPWTFIEEDEKHHLEATFMVVQCDSTSSNQVFLKIFNEKGKKDTANFDLKIYKQDNSDSTTKNITLQLNPGEMTMPMCGNNRYSNLKIDVPSGYDPKKIKVVVKFN